VDEDMRVVRDLFLAYHAWLDLDLCFQGFDEELASLPGKYGPPKGALLLAIKGGDAVGCAGVRPIDLDMRERGRKLRVCELKRLYVLDSARGSGIGRGLLRRALRDAKQMGYGMMVLDTIPDRMGAAIKLYEEFGFEPCEPYYENPLGNVQFMMRRLT
jgi:putative acetyltransferase